MPNRRELQAIRYILFLLAAGLWAACGNAPLDDPSGDPKPEHPTDDASNADAGSPTTPPQPDAGIGSDPDGSTDPCAAGLIFRDGHCWPELFDLVAPEQDAPFLSDLLGVYRYYDDWKNFKPLTDKVAALTAGLSTDEDKIRAIARWVYLSKTYCPDEDMPQCSPANSSQSFAQMWQSSQGVCLDAAILTAAMLRIAGIPSHHMMIGAGHIATVYRLAGRWHAVDTTFCSDPNNCSELFFGHDETSSATPRFILLYDRESEFEQNGVYQDLNSFAWQYPYQSVKTLQLADGDQGGAVIFPSMSLFNLSEANAEQPHQVACHLQLRDGICDSYGCFVQPSDPHTWMSTVGMSSSLYEQTSDGASSEVTVYGYSYAQLPAGQTYRYLCGDPISGNAYASLEFVLSAKQTVRVHPSKLVRANDYPAQRFSELIAVLQTSIDGIDLDQLGD